MIADTLKALFSQIRGNQYTISYRNLSLNLTEFLSLRYAAYIVLQHDPKFSLIHI